MVYTIDNIKEMVFENYDEKLVDENIITGEIIIYEKPMYESGNTKSVYEIVSYVLYKSNNQELYNEMNKYFLIDGQYFKNTKTIHESFSYGYSFHTLTFEQLELIVQDIFDYMNSAISLHSHT